jgi:hypothetical protein
MNISELTKYSVIFQKRKLHVHDGNAYEDVQCTVSTDPVNTAYIEPLKTEMYLRDI